MEVINIARLKTVAGETPYQAAFDSQLQQCQTRMTRTGKPYLEAIFVDATGQATLKVWNNHAQYEVLEGTKIGSFLRVTGEWTMNQYGLDAAHWDVRPLNEGEKQDFLAGDPETRVRQDGDWNYIKKTVSEVFEPRLRAMGEKFLNEHGDRFRRTAAARKNHHARRGGLVEHVAQMMRAAEAICAAYSTLNRDLLVVGVLFHDCGKLWENSYPADSFSQTVDLRGEMLGHIPIGLELVNKLWRELLERPESVKWVELETPSEHVRLHLLHLVGSHHGTYEFGSPVLPRTPEAYALHHIDNFDAKYEMLKDIYAGGSLAAPGIYERQFPLPAGAVEPLPYEAPIGESEDDERKLGEVNDTAGDGFLF